MRETGRDTHLHQALGVEAGGCVAERERGAHGLPEGVRARHIRVVEDCDPTSSAQRGSSLLQRHTWRHVPHGAERRREHASKLLTESCVRNGRVPLDRARQLGPDVVSVDVSRQPAGTVPGQDDLAGGLQPAVLEQVLQMGVEDAAAAEVDGLDLATGTVSVLQRGVATARATRIAGRGESPMAGLTLPPGTESGAVLSPEKLCPSQ